MSIRDQILQLDDEQIEEVYVPQWKMTVRVRGLTGVEKDAFIKTAQVQKPAANRAARRRGETVTEVETSTVVARICAWCIIDEEGRRVFSDSDVDELNRKNAAALELVSDVAMRLSGLTGEDIVEEKAEELLDNPFEDSSSSSQSTSTKRPAKS